MHEFKIICYKFIQKWDVKVKKKINFRVVFSLTSSCSVSLQWLRGLPSSRQSFNIVFGECPYCSKVFQAAIWHY